MSERDDVVITYALLRGAEFELCLPPVEGFPDTWKCKLGRIECTSTSKAGAAEMMLSTLGYWVLGSDDNYDLVRI